MYSVEGGENEEQDEIGESQIKKGTGCLKRDK